MGGWNGVYTTQGLNLLAKLSPGGTLNITRAVTGTGVVAETQLNYQTAVTGEKQELSFQTPSYPESGVCKLPVTLTNEGLTTGYTAHQIGFYATGADNKEILYFLAQSETGTDILPETDVSGYAATWVFYFQYGQADDVTVVVDPANAVTIDMLEEVRILALRGVSDQRFGNPVVFNESAKLPFAGLTLYGRSTQDGTPTPDNPVNIESVGDDGSVAVKVHGAQLLNLNDYTSESQGLTWVCKNGVVSVSGTTTATSSTSGAIYHNILGMKGMFTISGSSAKVSVYAAVTKDGETTWYKNQAFILDGTETQALVYCQVYGTGVIVNEKVYPMLNCGNKALPWEPYTGQNITLSTPNGLRGIPVSSGGNYTDTTGQQWICDEIDLVRGVYIQRIGKREFNGTESFTDYVSTNDSFTILQYHADNTPILCNYGKYWAAVTWANSQYLVFFASYFGVQTVAQFNALLAGYVTANNPLTIYYVKQSPTETDLSVDTLYANNPTTTVMNDSDVEMMVDCIRDVNENAFAMVLEKAGDSATLQATISALTEEVREKATTVTYNAVIPITEWATDTDQYTKEITVTGILETDNPITAPVWSTTAADRENEKDAWGCVELIETAANKIKVYANAVPETAITIQMKVVR